MNAWIFLFWASFAAANPSPELAQSPLAELAQSRAWLHFLHYRPSLLGPKSTADGPDFFLSPEGKLDPAKEMLATIGAFRLGASAKPIGPLKQIPLCAFPARRKFLERESGENFPAVDCKEFRDWKAGLAPESATYVFSSAYPNNPAAMFGHTFLRLDKAASGGRTSLMNYGVAFSANIPEGIDDFRYGLYGLLGGFSGFFSLAPYYTMANDYNNSEIRDLWEYPLKLSPEQVNAVVDHLWELYSTTYFDYYFFTENCTTQLLALLQAALPERDIFDGLPWYILPIDSIHQLKRLGLISDPVHRPSVKKKLVAAERTLSSAEKKDYRKLIDGRVDADSVSSPAVLDVAAAYWNYKKFLNRQLVDSPEQKELHKVLLRRAAMGKEETRPVSYSASSRPDLGHYSSAWGLGYGYREGRGRVRLDYRLGMHDLLDSEYGFESNAQIEFFSGGLSYLPARKKFRLEEFRLFEVQSLFPWDAYDQKLSWKISARLEPVQKVVCDGCYRGLFEGGGGVSVSFSESFLAYSLLVARSAYASQEKWDLGLGNESGFLLHFSPRLSARLQAKGEWDFFRSFGKSWFWDYSYAQAYSFSQRWELRGTFDWIPRSGRDEKAASARALYFF